jgi:hypothetical protein
MTTLLAPHSHTITMRHLAHGLTNSSKTWSLGNVSFWPDIFLRNSTALCQSALDSRPSCCKALAL